MTIERTSIITGNVNTMDLPITSDQLDSWMNGKLIQNAMPHLTATQREFLITGMSEEEQNKLYNQC